MSVREAFLLAQEKNSDLVEVAPNSDPPVCKIMDYGKFKYQLTKKNQESKKKQKTVQIKEVKFRMKTDLHDYNFKVKHIERFITHGDKVKVSLMFRGRENAHKELGLISFQRIIKDTEAFASVEAQPKIEGRNLTMLLVPNAETKETKNKSTAPSPAKTTD